MRVGGAPVFLRERRSAMTAVFVFDGYDICIIILLLIRISDTLE